MSNPLEFVTTEDLIEEILNRCDHGLITTVQIRSDDEVMIYRRWVGNSHTIVGLATDAQAMILAAYHERSKPK